jgi:hypothetical protein
MKMASHGTAPARELTVVIGKPARFPPAMLGG